MHILHIYNITLNIMISLSKKGPLTWNGHFSYMVVTPILAGLLHRVNCPILRSLRPQHLSPFPPLSANTSNIIHDINMPESALSGTMISFVRQQLFCKTSPLCISH